MIVEGRDTIPVIPEYGVVNRLDGKYYYVLDLGPGAGSVLYNSDTDQTLRLSSVFEHRGGNGVLVSKPSGLVSDPFRYTLRSINGERTVEASAYEILDDHVRVVRADSASCYDFGLAPLPASANC